MRTTLTLAVLLLTSAPATADLSPRVRGAGPRETQLIQKTMDGSAVVRALVEAIEASDVIVYVQLTGAEGAGRAATRFVTVSGAQRFLRVVIGAMTPEYRRGGLLAHELQHVVEIARAREVRDDEGLRRLYEQIGEQRSARTSFETAAAREIGALVHRELTMPADRPREPAADTGPHTLSWNAGDALTAVVRPPLDGKAPVDASGDDAMATGSEERRDPRERDAAWRNP